MNVARLKTKSLSVISSIESDPASAYAALNVYAQNAQEEAAILASIQSTVTLNSLMYGNYGNY